MPQTVEFQRNLKHFKFCNFFNWKRGKATLRGIEKVHENFVTQFTNVSL